MGCTCPSSLVHVPLFSSGAAAAIAGALVMFTDIGQQALVDQWERTAVAFGRPVDDAAYARRKLERSQADERVKSTEGRVIEDVRTAGWNIEMNAKRMATTGAARELAEQRLDA